MAAFVTGAAALVTVLPFSRSYAWWIGMWDFPRVQIAIASAAMLLVLAFLDGAGKWALMAVAAACLAYQCWRMRPYTPLARKEMRLIAERSVAMARSTC